MTGSRSRKGRDGAGREASRAIGDGQCLESFAETLWLLDQHRRVVGAALGEEIFRVVEQAEGEMVGSAALALAGDGGGKAVIEVGGVGSGIGRRSHSRQFPFGLQHGGEGAGLV